MVVGLSAKIYMRVALVLIFLLGCEVVPRPPDNSIYQNQAPSSKRFELYETHHSPRKINALFVASDETIQRNFTPTLAEFYGQSNTPRLEDLVWWRYLPFLDKVYGTIVRIDHDLLDYHSLSSAVEYLEGKGEAYDIIILSHGFHNHLTNGAGNYFLSWRELVDWEGKLENLNMVFMQGCFSSTLSEDWLRAGAEYVLSYEELNRNFFYLEPFLFHYAKNDDIAHIVKYLEGSALADYFEYKHLYLRIVQELGYEDMKHYLREASRPQLFLLNDLPEQSPDI